MVNIEFLFIRAQVVKANKHARNPLNEPCGRQQIGGEDGAREMTLFLLKKKIV